MKNTRMNYRRTIYTTEFTIWI